MAHVSPEFTRVQSSAAEVEAYRKTHAGFRPTTYRVVCNHCGTRIWKSGLGVGAHRRACKHSRCSGAS